MIGFDYRGKRGLAMAEKPSLGSAIYSVYKNHKSKIPYEMKMAVQRGHLLELLHPDEVNEEFKEWNWDNLPITPERMHGWHYKVINEKRFKNFATAKERYEEIESEIKSGRYDFIIHIGDPDREGQLLVDLVLEKIGNTLPVMRYWQNAITEEKILKTLLNLRSNEEDFFVNLSKSAKERQHADYLVGMNLSRAATIKMGSRVSVGRVKITILNWICQRELEIENFKPETVYGVKSVYGDNFKGVLFKGSSNEKTDAEEQETDKEEVAGTIWFKTKKEADEFIKGTSNFGTVTEYKTKRIENYAPKLYKLSTIQVEAGKKFGYSAKEVLNILQSLYEAKLTTYARSNCEYIDSTEDLNGPLNAISNAFGLEKFIPKINSNSIDQVKKSKKWINDKVVEKHGHTAIIPTNKKANLNELSSKQRNIYEMIAKRYLAIFLPPLVQDIVNMVVTVDGSKTFRTKGKTLVYKGYSELFERNIKDVVIPSLNEGDNLDILNFEVAEKTTQCPKRYTSGELIEVCESPGKFLEDVTIKDNLDKLRIGTPATTSDIIDGLVTVDKYADWVDEGKRTVLRPNKAGRVIHHNLDKINFSLLKIDTTGYWEINLEEIASGKKEASEFEKEIMTTIISMIEEIKTGEMENVVIDNNKRVVVSKCHKCDGEIIETEKSFFCSNYSKNGCLAGGFKKVNGHKITVDEFKKLQTGDQIVIDAIFEEKNDKGKVINKRKYKQRLGFNDAGTISFVKSENKDSGYSCPACGKRILENDNAYACEGRVDKSCNVYVGKIVSNVILSKEDIDLILSGKDSRIIKKLIPIKNGKKGNPYDAILYIDKEKKTLARKFPNSPTEYVCPCCEKPLLRSQTKIFCSGNEDGSCHFQMYSKMYKKDIPKKDLEDMLELVRSGEISGKEEAFITSKPIETSFTCPYCSSKMLRDGMKIYCPNSELSFYRVIGNKLLTDEDVDNLLTAGKTNVKNGLISQKGHTYSAIMRLNFDTKEIKMEFVEQKEKIDYNCPICDHNLVKEGMKINCTDCSFNFWLKQGGVPLTKKEVGDLLTKYKTNIRQMKTKEGKVFSASIVVDFEKNGTKFVFDNKR